MSDCEYRIRKLTPMECFRLFDFSDEDFLTAKTGSRKAAKNLLKKFPEKGIPLSRAAEKQKAVSDTRLYKAAGNSIVQTVPLHIFEKLYEAMPYLFDDLRVGSYFSGIGAFEGALDKLYEKIAEQERERERE